MPKKSLICKSKLENVLLEFKNRITDEDGQIKTPTRSVWSDISQKLNSVYNSKYLYVYVKQNRGDILKTLGIDQRPEDNNEEECWKEAAYSSSGESEGSSTETQPECLRFIINLSAEEWEKIKPTNVNYNSLHHKSPQRYNILKPKVWTEIVNDHIWRLCSLPCCIAFKRAQVKIESTPFVKISGKCTSCQSKFRGCMISEPAEGKEGIFRCTYEGDYAKCITSKKRRLTGNSKDFAISEVCEKGVSPVLYRHSEALKFMDFGDPEPAHLPTSNTLRVMKCRYKKNELVSEDPIIALNHMMHDREYQGGIRALGYEPFYVYYWLQSQMHVYNMYCKLNANSVLCIDATGGVVKKLKRPFGLSSSNIFLYDVTILDNVSNMQYSVCSMLSEAHDNNSIYHWLAIWMRSGVEIPKEVVCDHSVALLSAVVKAFTQYTSMVDYIQACADLTLNHKLDAILPKCYIRCDVAHTLKIISSWPVLKSKTYRTRNFYIRCIAQLIL